MLETQPHVFFMLFAEIVAAAMGSAGSGTHTTKWVVDPDNHIAELDETNNQKEYTFTVGSQTTNGPPTVSDLNAGQGVSTNCRRIYYLDMFSKRPGG